MQLPSQPYEPRLFYVTNRRTAIKGSDSRIGLGLARRLASHRAKAIVKWADSVCRWQHDAGDTDRGPKAACKRNRAQDLQF